MHPKNKNFTDLLSIQKERQRIAGLPSVSPTIPSIDTTEVESLARRISGGEVRRNRFALESALLGANTENPIAEGEQKRRILEGFGGNLATILSNARKGALSQKTREFQVEANAANLSAQLEIKRRSDLLNSLTRTAGELRLQGLDKKNVPAQSRTFRTNRFGPTLQSTPRRVETQGSLNPGSLFRANDALQRLGLL